MRLMQTSFVLKGNRVAFPAILIGLATLTGCATLQDAAREDDLPKAERLIARGADVNAGDPFDTPLHIATINRHSDMAKLLIEHGAHMSCFELFEFFGDDPIIVKITIDHLTDAKDADHFCMSEAIRKGGVDRVKHLIDLGVNVNEDMANWNHSINYTPLYSAIVADQLEVAKLLIDHGANVNHSDFLLLAVDQQSREMARLLMNHGADVDASLIMAAELGNVDAVQRLVDWGSEKIKEDEYGKASDVACAKVTTGECRKDAIVNILTRAAQAQQSGSAVCDSDLAAAVPDEAAFRKGLSDVRSSQAPHEVPEESHKLEVEARYAVRDNHFKDAAALYAQALRAAPWWARGYYNHALILGQLKCYKDAALEMRRYLLLSPKAPNAKQSREKMYGWDYEAKKQQ